MRSETDRLAEQKAYYRAVAAEYEDHALAEPGEDELVTALVDFEARGSVLELACGPGTWTEILLRHADSLTAVDAAPEMLEIAARRIDDERVEFIEADLFEWRPPAKFDVVFFGFLLSHIPDEVFGRFWMLVANCLSRSGRVFFVDDAHRSPEELREEDGPSAVHRRLNDGTEYEIVKVPHRPAELEARLRRLGWDATVNETAGPFYWGTAKPSKRSG